uniref:Poly(A) polymerase I n=1 Tax=Pseudomonas phage Cygsa01 TaxID=3138529 RepID=A0AAU6W404_9VIRU
MGAQRKTIRRVLRAKVAEWIDSIEDNELQKLARRDTIITGGAIASLLLGQAPNDFDVYFKTKETALAISRYYIEQFSKTSSHVITLKEDNFTNIDGESEERIFIQVSSSGVAGQTEEDVNEREEEAELADLLRDAGSKLPPLAAPDAADEPDSPEVKRYQPTFISQNAITLSNKVQLIIRFFGSPDEIHKNYDFIHCQNWYTYQDDVLELKPEALEALMSKSLVYTGSLYPICSLLRVRKFLKREWKINAGQILKMAIQCKKIDFTDARVLSDQLNGCDSHYFNMLIRAMHAPVLDGDGEAVPRELSESYVVELIDRIFGH